MAYAFQEGKFTNYKRVFLFVCFGLIWFGLELSSRNTETAGLLPAQRDREQREEDEKPSRPEERKHQRSSVKVGGDFAEAIGVGGGHCPKQGLFPVVQMVSFALQNKQQTT